MGSHPLDGRCCGAFTLRTGHYGNGRLAIEVIAADGIPECTLTVNIVGEHLEPGEIHVRAETQEFAADACRDIVACGVACPTGRWVPAGFVRRYAEVWVLKEGDR